MKNINYLILLIIVFSCGNVEKEKKISNSTSDYEATIKYHSIFFDNVLVTRDSFKLKENRTKEFKTIPDSLFNRYRMILRNQNKLVREGEFIRYKDGFLNKSFKGCINPETNELDREAISELAEKKSHEELFPMMITKYGIKGGPISVSKQTRYMYKLKRSLFYAINPLQIFCDFVLYDYLIKGLKR